MSKLSKRIIITIIILATILGISTISKAANRGTFTTGNVPSYNVGDTVLINDNIFYHHSGGKMYCVEHGQHMPQQLTSYTLASIVDVVGNKSTDYNGGTRVHPNNARLVGILASGAGHDTIKHSVWTFMKTWIDTVGKYHAGLSAGFAGSTPGDPVSLDSQAVQYMNSFEENNQPISDATEENNLSAKQITFNDKSYVRMGPFKWTFSGKISQFKVQIKNATGNSYNTVNNVLVAKMQGTQLVQQNASDIASGSKFYILIPNEKVTSGNIKISASNKVEVKKSKIWFFKSSVGMDQNLIYTSPGTDYNNFDFEKEYDNLKVFGKIQVIKVDKDGHNVLLPNVGFKIKNNDTNKYVLDTDSSGNHAYGNENQAKVFRTGTSGDNLGKILTGNLLVGSYTIIEVDNPDAKYKLNTDNKETNVVVGETKTVTIENERYKGGLKVIKRDKDQPDVLLNGVTFRFKDKTTGKYVKRDENGEISYVNKANATIFTTGADGENNGEITIENLSVGDYEAIEINNPDTKYKVLTESQEKEVVKNTLVVFEIDNERYKGNLKVIKVDKDGHEVKLNDVGFKIKFEDFNQYVVRDANGKISYTDDINSATEFFTGKDGEAAGEITVDNLLVGTYYAFETQNPDEHYILNEETQNQPIELTKGQTASIMIENERYKGSLKVIKRDKDKHDLLLKGVKFKFIDEITGKYVKQDENKNITYVSEEQATIFETDENGEITIENLSVGNYLAVEVSNPDEKYKMITEPQEKEVLKDTLVIFEIDNERYKGNLKVIKVDKENHEVKLNGVGFKIKFEDFNQYVVRDENGEISYTDDINLATEFFTGADGEADGEITVDNLLVGTYTAFETQNPDKHYKFIEEGQVIDVEKEVTVDLMIENKEIFIDLSGYVWIDENTSKQSIRNDLYKQDETDVYVDDKDELLNDITVRLMRKRGENEPAELIATQKTSKLDRYVSDGNDGNGEYFFPMVPMYDENDTVQENTILDQYYIEFEYDGITYTNVAAKIDMDRGSKASENNQERQTFNNKFSVIDGSSVDATNNTGLKRIDANDKSEHSLSYTKDAENHRATVNHDESCLITASTKGTGDDIETKYDIKEHRILRKNRDKIYQSRRL